jgi:uncharacterized protein (TIGR02996 family)
MDTMRRTPVALHPELEALLAGVAAKPDDDLPRLVTADWFEEHGQPERAEFIRLQVDIARNPRGSCDRPARGSRRWRASRLLAAHRKRWAAEELGPGIKVALYDRGFVEKIAAHAARFLRSGRRWLDRAPVRTVQL